jgi:hypothetical protein
VVQEMSRLVDVETPIIDAVLALVQQLGRVAKVYPTFSDKTLAEEERTGFGGSIATTSAIDCRDCPALPQHDLRLIHHFNKILSVLVAL